MNTYIFEPERIGVKKLSLLAKAFLEHYFQKLGSDIKLPDAGETKNMQEFINTLDKRLILAEFLEDLAESSGFDQTPITEIKNRFKQTVDASELEYHKNLIEQNTTTTSLLDLQRYFSAKNMEDYAHKAALKAVDSLESSTPEQIFLMAISEALPALNPEEKANRRAKLAERFFGDVSKSDEAKRMGLVGTLINNKNFSEAIDLVRMYEQTIGKLTKDDVSFLIKGDIGEFMASDLYINDLQKRLAVSVAVSEVKFNAGQRQSVIEELLQNKEYSEAFYKKHKDRFFSKKKIRVNGQSVETETVNAVSKIHPRALSYLLSMFSEEDLKNGKKKEKKLEEITDVSHLLGIIGGFNKSEGYEVLCHTFDRIGQVGPAEKVSEACDTLLKVSETLNPKERTHLLFHAMDKSRKYGSEASSKKCAELVLDNLLELDNLDLQKMEPYLPRIFLENMTDDIEEKVGAALYLQGIALGHIDEKTMSNIYKTSGMIYHLSHKFHKELDKIMVPLFREIKKVKSYYSEGSIKLDELVKEGIVTFSEQHGEGNPIMLVLAPHAIECAKVINIILEEKKPDLIFYELGVTKDDVDAILSIKKKVSKEKKYADEFAEICQLTGIFTGIEEVAKGFELGAEIEPVDNEELRKKFVEYYMFHEIKTKEFCGKSLEEEFLSEEDLKTIAGFCNFDVEILKSLKTGGAKQIGEMLGTKNVRTSLSLDRVLELVLLRFPADYLNAKREEELVNLPARVYKAMKSKENINMYFLLGTDHGRKEQIVREGAPYTETSRIVEILEKEKIPYQIITVNHEKLPINTEKRSMTYANSVLRDYLGGVNNE